MKNAMDPDCSVIMLKINRVGEAAYENPSEGINTRRIMFGIFGDLRVGSREASKEFLSQSGVLFLIPPITVVGIPYSLGD